MAKYREIRNIIVEHAEIGFRNFEGKESKFNDKGKRNFCVFFDESTGRALAADGWNVRWVEQRDPDEELKCYLQVAVSFDNIPPKILLLSGQGKTLLDDSTVEVLDWIDIENVDLIISPYQWSVQDKSGVKAYLKSMYVTMEEDEFAAKYYDEPEVCDVF